MILISLICFLFIDNEKKLTAKLDDMLRQLDYDSVVINYDRALLNSGLWKKEKPLHPGTNFLRIEQEKKIKIVQVKVQLFKKAAVIQQYIRRADLIKNKSYRFEIVDITHMRDVLSDEELKEKWFARKSLKKGTVLNRKNTRKEYDIRFGEPIDILYRSKNIKLQVKAVSKKNAFIGDRIPVELINGKRIKAVLRRKGQAVYDKN